MRGFRKLVFLGVILVTLLFVIDIIDAGKKQSKKKGFETEATNDQTKNQQTDSIKQGKVKKTGTQKTEKNVKYVAKDRKNTNNENTKSSKPSFQKVKKYKVLDEEPTQKFDWSKSKIKNTKPKYSRAENVDTVFKSVKKTSQKKLIEENENVEKILNEELSRLKNEESISVEETIGDSPKKRKYKLVEVVLQEDGQEEEQEGNETIIEVNPEDEDFINIQNELLAAKTKETLNPKTYKNKKSSKKSTVIEENYNENSENEEETSDSEFSDRTFSDAPYDDSYSSRYEEPTMQSCKSLPEDPNRQGPKKLTLYVIEEEINGQIKKRVVSEEDGVTMCEVADLLKEMYGMANP